MESDEVAAVKVRKTGDKDMSTRNIMIDDFMTFRSLGSYVLYQLGRRATRTIDERVRIALLLARKGIPRGVTDEK